MIVVPFYDTLSVKRNFEKIIDIYPGIEEYFPMYEEVYLPSRKFFWEVFATLHYDDAIRIVNRERDRRFVKEEQEKKEVIEVDPMILNELQSVNYFSKQKGRALYKMKPKEHAVFDRKRKWEELVDPYDEDRTKTPFMISELSRPAKRMKVSRSDEKVAHLGRNDMTSTAAKTFKTPSEQKINNPFAQKSNPFKKQRG